MKQHQQPNKGKSSVWLTPRWILDRLGRFDLDPCAAPSPRPWDIAATRHIELPEDGLNVEWGAPARTRVWCNPPFGKGERELWMYRMALHGNGIMLIPAATETAAFSDFVWKEASAVLFLNRRPHFHYPDGTQAKANSGCSICLVSYDWEIGQFPNREQLEQSALGVTAKNWKL